MVAASSAYLGLPATLFGYPNTLSMNFVSANQVQQCIRVLEINRITLYRLSSKQNISSLTFYPGLSGNVSMIFGVLLSGYLMKKYHPSSGQVAACKLDLIYYIILMGYSKLCLYPYDIVVAVSKYIYAFGLYCSSCCCLTAVLCLTYQELCRRMAGRCSNNPYYASGRLIT